MIQQNESEIKSSYIKLIKNCEDKISKGHKVEINKQLVAEYIEIFNKLNLSSN